MEPTEVTVDAPTFQQQAVVIYSTSPHVIRTEAQKSCQRKLRGLAISELVLGTFCILIGSALAGITANIYFPHYSYYSERTYNRLNFTTGEGIWCGVWVIVAGALGVRSAALNASRCMIVCHMAFSIVAAVFCASMFSIGIVASIISAQFLRFGVEYVLALNCIISIMGFVLMILFIISASFCCYVIGCCNNGSQGGCCGNGCNCSEPYNYNERQVVNIQHPEINRQFYPQQAVNPNQAVAYPGQTVFTYPQQTPTENQGIMYVHPPLQGDQPSYPVQPAYQATASPSRSAQVQSCSALPNPNAQLQSPPMQTHTTLGATYENCKPL